MTVYIGVDFHPYEQSVAFGDDGDGEIGYRRFLHSDKQSLKVFYRKVGRGCGDRGRGHRMSVVVREVAGEQRVETPDR